MADISQLEVNGTTYNICDATARDSLSQFQTTVQNTYLPLSGGHMTGGITFDSGSISITNSGLITKTGIVVSDGNFYANSPAVDRNGAAPSTDQIRGVYLRDKDGEALGVFQSIYRGTNGRSEVGICAYNSAKGEATGSSTQCYIKTQVDKDGTQSYALSSPLAFRKAISGIWPIYPDVKRGTAPSSIVYSEGLQWYDNKSSPSRLGFIRTNYQADGKNVLQLTACNSNAAGTTEYTNSLSINVTNTGVQSYTVGDPGAFRSAIGMGTNAIGTINHGTGTNTFLRNDGTWATPPGNKVAFNSATLTLSDTTNFTTTDLAVGGANYAGLRIVYVNIKTKVALTAGTNYSIGTLKINGSAISSTAAYGNASTAGIAGSTATGAITFRPLYTVSSGSVCYLRFIYM